jgi:hypothetical protein
LAAELPRQAPTYEATYHWAAGACANAAKRVTAKNGVVRTATAAFAVRPEGRAPSVSITNLTNGAPAGP